MNKPISQADFIEMLKAGVDRTVDFMAARTDYHGGPTTTEYILTADIARALLEKGLEVEVECHNRRLVNGLTRRKMWKPRMRIGGQRTDVVVLEAEIIPRVMVEVKIGVGATLTRIRRDLDKICNTLECIKATFALGVRAASLFQVHVPGRQNDIKVDRLQKKVAKIEKSLAEKLEVFAIRWPAFAFNLVSLQGSSGGYVATEIVYEDENNASLGRSGHATRYYAILIRSLRKQPSETGLQRLRNEG